MKTPDQPECFVVQVKTRRARKWMFKGAHSRLSKATEEIERLAQIWPDVMEVRVVEYAPHNSKAPRA